MNFIRSLVFAIYLVVSIPIYAILVLITIPIPFHAHYRLTVFWPKMTFWLMQYILGIKYTIKGAENIPKDQPVIFLVKHQSAYETLFLPWYSPLPVVFVYKKTLEQIPFFGWALASLKNIPINRSKGTEAMQQVLRIGTKRIKEGRNPVLFPEGTRIPIGQKGRYKSGGARLAVHSSTPIIPLAHNAGLVWPKNSFIKKPGLVTFSFGPLIETKDRKPDLVNKEVEAWIENEVRSLNPEYYN